VLELLVVLVGVGVLGGAALLVATLPPLTLLYGAAGLSGLGCLLGFPFGALYHLVLRRELLRQGPLPRGWIWHPTRLHGQLAPEGLARVRPWFVLGALGFLLVMLGAGLATVTLATHFR